jgi:8-hydroxy-5-deazaflavin:NADPH oxidoreductase
MKIAILGTGTVGRTLATKLVSLGHQVRLGSRTADNEAAAAWVAGAGSAASTGTFGAAAAFGEIVFNCTAGTGSMAALEAAGEGALAGKTLVDVSNPLDFSKGFPPTLFVCNDDSLGERIQRAFPKTRVVKTLNTVNCNVMVDPGRLPGEHVLFVSGDDAAAKAQVKEILTTWLGWKRVIDLGGITTCRGTESYLQLWLSLMGALRTADFNVQLVTG